MDVATIGKAFAGLFVALLVGQQHALGQAAPWLQHQPVVVGDFFGFGPSRVVLTETESFAFDTVGSIVSGNAGNANAVLVFEANGGTPDDFFTDGVGSDQSGDGFADTFPIAEPLAPNEVPVSPGADFSFEQGNVVYTNGSGTTPVDGAFADGDTWRAEYSFSRAVVVDVGAAGAGGIATRRIKIGENNSAVPKDRILFDYRFFNNALAQLGDVNRFNFGFEKTFAQGFGSLLVRVPFASTLDSIQTFNGAAARDVELGNLTLAWKRVLFLGDRSMLSGGWGFTLPTASDTKVRLSSGPTIVEIENEATHFLPYLAYIASDGVGTLQAFLQLDFDTKGNTVRGDLNGTNLQKLGTLDDATWLFFDLAYSQWVMQCHDPSGTGLTGVAPFIELHLSTTVSDVDRVAQSGIDVGNADDRFDIFNLTTGLHLRYGQNTYVSPAFAFPLQSNDDQAFDFEFALLVNRSF